MELTLTEQMLIEKKFAFIDFLKIIDKKFKKSECGKLKILMLLFFTTAISVESDDKGLLSVFNNYYAMKYGPIESDIYKMLNNNDFNEYLNFQDGFFKLNKKALNLNPSIHYEKINSAIDNLNKENSDIFYYSAMQLVELSHTWSSWKICFGFAKRNNKQSIRILNELFTHSKTDGFGFRLHRQL